MSKVLVDTNHLRNALTLSSNSVGSSAGSLKSVYTLFSLNKEKSLLEVGCSNGITETTNKISIEPYEDLIEDQSVFVEFKPLFGLVNKLKTPILGLEIKDDLLTLSCDEGTFSFLDCGLEPHFDFESKSTLAKVTFEYEQLETALNTVKASAFKCSTHKYYFESVCFNIEGDKASIHSVNDHTLSKFSYLDCTTEGDVPKKLLIPVQAIKTLLSAIKLLSPISSEKIELNLAPDNGIFFNVFGGICTIFSVIYTEDTPDIERIFNNLEKRNKSFVTFDNHNLLDILNVFEPLIKGSHTESVNLTVLGEGIVVSVPESINAQGSSKVVTLESSLEEEGETTFSVAIPYLKMILSGGKLDSDKVKLSFCSEKNNDSPILLEFEDEIDEYKSAHVVSVVLRR